MKKKVKKWLSCMMAAAMVMSTVNLPVDVFASEFSDGTESLSEEEENETPEVIMDDGEEKNSEENTIVAEDFEMDSDEEEAESEIEFSASEYEDENIGAEENNSIEEAGNAQTSTEWVWPTYNHTIKSDWPNYSSGSYHGGTDFPVPLNTSVYSSCDGEVVSVQYLTTSYGKHIKVKAKVNGNVVYIRYCHLNSINVKVGDKVRAGQEIGKSGSTGNSTGPHLHYEVRNSALT